MTKEEILRTLHIVDKDDVLIAEATSISKSKTRGQPKVIFIGLLVVVVLVFLYFFITLPPVLQSVFSSNLGVYIIAVQGVLLGGITLYVLRATQGHYNNEYNGDSLFVLTKHDACILKSKKEVLKLDSIKHVKWDIRFAIGAPNYLETLNFSKDEKIYNFTLPPILSGKSTDEQQKAIAALKMRFPSE